MHLLETAGNHAGTHNMGRLPCIVLEQTGTPAARQNRIREHETRQIQQLAHVVTHAQMFDGKIHHLVSILPGQGCRAADAQMLFAVMTQWGNDGSLPQQGFNHQRFAQVAIIMCGQPRTCPWVTDVIETPDIQGSVCPRRQDNRLDDFADTRLTGKQDNIGGAYFTFKKLEIAQGAEVFFTRDGV